MSFLPCPVCWDTGVSWTLGYPHPCRACDPDTEPAATTLSDRTEDSR